MKTAPAPRRASTSESITLSKERVEKKGIPLVVPLLGAVAIIGVAVFALRESGGDVANELPASSAATEFGPDAGADTGVTSASALPTLDAGMFTLDAGVEDVVPLQNVEFNFDDEPDTGGPELPSNVSVEADDSPVRNEIAIPQTIDPVTEDRLRQVRVELSEDELERMLERDPDAGR